MMPSVSRSPLRTPGTVSKERDDKAGSTADVPGFGLAVVLFLPGAAYLGITNGHDFIENDFFAFMYCLAGVGFASVPLMSRSGIDVTKAGMLSPGPPYGAQGRLS